MVEWTRFITFSLDSTVVSGDGGGFERDSGFNKPASILGTLFNSFPEKEQLEMIGYFKTN
jgi:hypothetical protein